MTPWNLQPVVKLETWDPDIDTDDNSESVITFGFNYFLNDWTRLQVNYLYKAEADNYTSPDGIVGERSNDELLMQLQVKF